MKKIELAAQAMLDFYHNAPPGLEEEILQIILGEQGNCFTDYHISGKNLFFGVVHKNDVLHSDTITNEHPDTWHRNHPYKEDNSVVVARVNLNFRRFIIWDKRDSQFLSGQVTRDENNHIISEGIIGRIPVDSAYLTLYAQYPGTQRPGDLKIYECIQDVVYELSGTTGTYDIYRVR